MKHIIQSIGDIRKMRELLQFCEEQCRATVCVITKYQYAQMLAFAGADRPKNYPLPSEVLRKSQYYYCVALTLKNLLEIVRCRFNNFMEELLKTK